MDLQEFFRVKLITDWEVVLKKAWSIRMSIIAAIASILEASCLYFEKTIMDAPPGAFSFLACLFAIGGVVLRIIDQNIKK